MKKLNKVLALLCASAIVASTGALAACTNSGHNHADYLQYVTDGYDTHHAECSEDDYTTQPEAHDWGTDGKCTKCGQAKKVAVTSVTVSGEKQVKIGASITLTADVAPQNASEKTVSWAIKSGNEFADITSAGVLTGKAAGTVVVKATADGVSGEYSVQVLSAEAITISGNYVVLEDGYDAEGEYDDLRTMDVDIDYTGSGTLTVTPNDGEIVKAELAADNSKVTLTAKKAGKATLTVSDGEEEKKLTVEVATYGLEYGVLTEEGDGEETKYIVVSGSDRLTATDIYIPGYYWSLDDEDYLPVTTISGVTGAGGIWSGDGAFNGRNITSVYTGDNVETIMGNAFKECENLADVKFGPALKVISGHVFEGDTKLVNISFDNVIGLKSVLSGAFMRTGITEITFPKTCDFLGDAIFSGSTAIKKVRILGAVEIIYNDAFFAQGGDIIAPIEEIWIPASVTEIKGNAFGNFSGEIPEGMTANINIYYAGDAEQWQSISIGANNPLITDNPNIKWHYSANFDEMLQDL